MAVRFTTTVRVGTMMGMHSSDSLPISVISDVASRLAPGLGPLTAKALNAVRSEWARNHSKALSLAARSAGMSREDLQDALAEDPALVPLVSRLLWEAAMTGNDKIIECLAAVFGQAVRRGSVVYDDTAVVLKEISGLHPEDIHVLQALRDFGPIMTESSNKENAQIPGDVRATTKSGALHGGERTALSIQRLESHGFAYRTPGLVIGGSPYHLSHYGRTLCEALALLSEADEL